MGTSVIVGLKLPQDLATRMFLIPFLIRVFVHQVSRFLIDHLVVVMVKMMMGLISKLLVISVFRRATEIHQMF